MSPSSKITSVAVVLLAVGVIASGCGVSQTKYANATTSLETANTKNADLQKQLDAAKTESADLQQKVDGMQSSVNKLNDELAQQKQANAQAQSTYEGMVHKLQSDVNSGHVQIEKMRDGIRVNLAQDILFKSGSAALDPAGKELLGKVAEELKTSSYEVVVIGHTDNQKIGGKLAVKFPDNWALGAARAGSIVSLFQGAGVAPARLLAVSAGENRPRGDNSTPEGREQNRRIEVRLRPVEIEATAGE
jgi:chemotaxis protein MotB